MFALRVVHHHDRRLRDGAKLARLAAMIHAELDRRRAVRRRQPEQRQRQPDRVVEIALGCEHCVGAEVRAEDRGQHFLDRGLAVAADHDRERQREASAPVRGKARPAPQADRAPPAADRVALRRALRPRSPPPRRCASADSRRSRGRRSARLSARRRGRPRASRGCRWSRGGTARCSPCTRPDTTRAAVAVSIMRRSTRRAPRSLPPHRRTACARRRAPGMSRGPCRRQHDVAGPRVPDRATDRRAAIVLDRPPAMAGVADALHDRIGDSRRVFAARVVAGHHDALGKARRDGAHLRPLARIAVAAAAEHAHELAAVTPPRASAPAATFSSASGVCA